MKTYTIKEGSHYSCHLPKFVYKEYLINAFIKFHSDCWFPLIHPDDYAINKLVGWSNGIHHHNSIRCGWRPTAIPGYIDLFFYIYSNGKRMDSHFTTVQCDKEFMLIMTYQNGKVTFIIGEHLVSIEMDYSGPALGYMLFPYFGGRNTAPHDVHIDLDIK